MKPIASSHEALQQAMLDTTSPARSILANLEEKRLTKDESTQQALPSRQVQFVSGGVQPPGEGAV